MNKKLIFVLGADFSGTTLLDLTLGSAVESASLGEVASFFNPTSSHHLNPLCSCQSKCGLWNRNSINIKDPYRQFFDFHDRNVLVDSSKDPSWVATQSRIAKNSGTEVFMVLIWKQADEYARSCANRGNPYGWADKWLRYHRAVAQLNMPIYTLSLNSIRNNNSETLDALCSYLGLTYSEEMNNLKSKTHHIAFGSSTARQSLHTVGSDGWQLEHYRSHRNDIQGKTITKPVELAGATNQSIRDIQNLLTPDGLKPAKLLPGQHYLRKAIVRKRLERATYLLGLNPSAVRRPIRALDRYRKTNKHI